MLSRIWQKDHHPIAKPFLAFSLAFALAACAVVPKRVQPRNEIIGNNQRFIIIAARAGDTYATIAARHLGAASQSWRIAEFNKYKPVEPNTLIVIPKVDLNPTGITSTSIQRVPILCYHRFTTGGKPDKLEVTAAQFEEQIQFLKRNGFTVVSLADFHAFTQGQKQLPKKSVVITIDDGYRTIYSVAYPIIQRHRIPVTAYIYTDFIGSAAALTWAQIREMQKSGLVDFQSHSKSHSKLSERGRSETPSAYTQRVKVELADSRSLIAKQLGQAVDFLAYPYGGTNAFVAEQAKAAGYHSATTVLRGTNPAYAPPLLLRRDMVFGTDSMALFARRLGLAADGKELK